MINLNQDSAKAKVAENVYIYKELSENLRKNPEVLKQAICNCNDDFNPLEYALLEALTRENVLLAVAKQLEPTKEMLSIKEIVKVYMMYYSVYIYIELPATLQTNPEILKLAVDMSEGYFNPLAYISPNSITNEFIDWLISEKIFPETSVFLNNKYYILNVAEKRPKILGKISETLKKDSQIQRLCFIYNEKFLEVIGVNSIQQFLHEYSTEYNLSDYDIKDVLDDELFIKRVLKKTPQAYTLLVEEQQKEEENIRIILEDDCTNLIFVPLKYITGELIALAKKPYGELFEMLDDSSRILDFLEMIRYYEKIFAYALYIFAIEQNLLDKFIDHLSNNEKSIAEMLKIIKNSRQLFANFLNMISSSAQAKHFFDELLKENHILIPKKISDDSELWSPVDLSFKKVYKFVQGVIGIDKNGEIIEISLDYTIRHHCHATAEIGIRTGCVVEKSNDPFLLGRKVSRQGTLIIQIEGSSMKAYLPDGIPSEQYNSLMQVLEQCKEMKKIGFTYKEDNPYEDADVLKITLDDLINFVSYATKC